MIEQHPVAVSALQQKRAEIAGEIVDLEKRLVDKRNDLAVLDRALDLMGSPVPGAAIPAKRKRREPAGYIQHGETSRRILEGVREHGTITAAELADIAMRDKGLDDKAVRTMILRRFLTRLYQMREDGRIAQIPKERGQPVRWRLADQC